MQTESTCKRPESAARCLAALQAIMPCGEEGLAPCGEEGLAPCGEEGLALAGSSCR